MASKNRFNIVLGATINKEALQKELNKISETKIKINIDTEHLRAQIQNVFNNIKINIGGASSSKIGAGGTDSYYERVQGSFTQTAKSSASVFKLQEEQVQHAKSVTQTLDEQDNAIRRVVSGYDELGRKSVQYYQVAKDGSEKLVKTTVEEGNLINKNAQAYDNLSARLEQLHQKKQITNQDYTKLKGRLDELNPALDKSKEKVDQFDKNRKFKQLGQDISDASKHTMTFGGMLKTAYEKFANFTPKIATSYRNVC